MSHKILKKFKVYKNIFLFEKNISMCFKNKRLVLFINLNLT